MDIFTLTLFICVIFQFGTKTSNEDEFEESEKVENGILEEGRWSPWMPWQCSTSCGQGILFRKRYCIPGTDLGFGTNDCKGAAVQRSPKHCHRPCQKSFSRFNFQRNKPAFSSEVEKAMTENLKSHMISMVRKKEVNLDCGRQLTEMLTKTYTGSRITWTHNDQLLQFDIHRMISPENGIIKIFQLSSKDNGVYMCELQFEDETVGTLGVFSLIVETSEPHVILKEGEKLQLNCNCASLIKLSTPLNVIWLHEGNAIVDRPITTNKQVFDFDIISNKASKNYSGAWICTVQAPELHVKWITNLVNVIVNDIDNPHTKAPGKIFYWVLGGILLILIAAVNISIICHKFGLYKKKKRQMKSDGRQFETENLLSLNK